MVRDLHPPSRDSRPVKAALTPKSRNRPVVENDTYAAFTCRVIAAHARRIATGDIERLGDLIALYDDLDAAIASAVTGLRACGYSWTEIADRLGITRQAAHQRWATDT
ncbi:MAG: hypothetical protein GEV09_08355 [Pseudonocardiaceae bacterium]|nr:hypothetical protein [Pseudonocardiaceae bacterium]